MKTETQTSLVSPATKEVYDPDFKWKTKDHRQYKIKDMATSHLFNTVRMIWNHTMPIDAATHRYKRYSFSSHYTEDYMIAAVRNMVPELSTRKDLTTAQMHTLYKMAQFLRKRFSNGAETQKWIDKSQGN